MRWRWLSLLLLPQLCACGSSRRAVEYARYQPSLVESESWCRLGEGAYAFVPRPQVAPSLVGSECSPPRRDPLPEMTRPGSTFAELVVEPGGAIEIPVQLPKALQDAGCLLDSVLIPHGERASDIAIEIATSGGGVVPIVSYAKLPPPSEDGVMKRAVVDGSGAPRSFRAADTEGNALEVTADPELWPTGAKLSFNGGRTPDGAATVVFEIEQAPAATDKPAATDEPATDSPSPAGTPPSGSKPPPIAPSPGPSPGAPAPYGPSPYPPSPKAPAPGVPAPYGPSPYPPSPSAPSPSAPSPDAPAPSAGTDAPTSDETETSTTTDPPSVPPRLELIAYRHHIDIPAPNAFSIVLRARELPFGVGVRSDRESPDPRLSYRAPGAAEPTPTHLVPLVGVVVARCGRPLGQILRDIR